MTTTATTAEFYYVAPHGRIDRHLAGDGDLNMFAGQREAYDAAASLADTLGDVWDVIYRVEDRAGGATLTVVATR
jgi:hypothetical protein